MEPNNRLFQTKLISDLGKALSSIHHKIEFLKTESLPWENHGPIIITITLSSASKIHQTIADAILNVGEYFKCFANDWSLRYYKMDYEDNVHYYIITISHIVA